MLRAAGCRRLRIAKTTISSTPTPSVRKAPVNKAANGRIVPPSILHQEKENKRDLLKYPSAQISNAVKREEMRCYSPTETMKKSPPNNR